MKLLRLALEQNVVDSSKDWVGFDWDGTVVTYNGWKGIMQSGEPIPKTIALMKRYMNAGIEVRIFTARVSLPEWQGAPTARGYIEDLCLQFVGQKLKITNEKDMNMICLYDDRCRQVIENTGDVVGETYPGLD